MNINNNENIFGKPILFNKSIVFDLLGNQLPNSHPIIVFYDQDQDEYWYVGARSAFDKLGNKRTPFKEEIEVKASKEGLFKKDSLIDTSKIYRIDRKLFHSLNVQNVNVYHLTKELSNSDIRTILDSICANAYLEEISVAKVFLDKNTNALSQELQYCGKEVIDEVIERIKYPNEQKSIKIGNKVFFGTQIECFFEVRDYVLKELNPKNGIIAHYVSETVGELVYNFNSKTGIYDNINGDEYTPDVTFYPFGECNPLNYKEENFIYSDYEKKELESSINKIKEIEQKAIERSKKQQKGNNEEFKSNLEGDPEESKPGQTSTLKI